jgi:hypothetical protein
MPRTTRKTSTHASKGTLLHRAAQITKVLASLGRRNLGTRSRSISDDQKSAASIQTTRPNVSHRIVPSSGIQHTNLALPCKPLDWTCPTATISAQAGTRTPTSRSRQNRSIPDTSSRTEATVSSQLAQLSCDVHGSLHAKSLDRRHIALRLWILQPSKVAARGKILNWSEAMTSRLRLLLLFDSVLATASEAGLARPRRTAHTSSKLRMTKASSTKPSLASLQASLCTAGSFAFQPIWSQRPHLSQERRWPMPDRSETSASQL